MGFILNLSDEPLIVRHSKIPNISRLHVYWDKPNYQNQWKYCMYHIDTCNVSHFCIWCQTMGIPKDNIGVGWMLFGFPRSVFAIARVLIIRNIVFVDIFLRELEIYFTTWSRYHLYGWKEPNERQSFYLWQDLTYRINYPLILNKRSFPIKSKRGLVNEKR